MSNIIFGPSNGSIEVLRLSKDGIWANPDVPADEAAKLVLAAIDSNIKLMIERAVEAEREACAQVCDGLQDIPATEPRHCAQDIRLRWQK